MKLLKLIEFLRERLKTVIYACLAVLVALVLLDAVFVDKEHAAHTSVEHLFGFWAVFGLVGCIFLIIASKAFGHAGIMKREDYYDK